MTALRRRFFDLYGSILPPLVRDVLAGGEASAFLHDRLESVRRLGNGPVVTVRAAPGLWNTSAIEVVMPDLPFIADTTLGLVDSLGLTIRFRVLALFDVRRSPSGELVDMLPPQEGGPPRKYRRESWTFIALDPIDASTATLVRRHLQRNLKHLVRMGSDFPAQLKFLSEARFSSPTLVDQQHWLLQNAILMGSAVWNASIPSSHRLGMLAEKDVRAGFDRWLETVSTKIAPATGEAIRVLETELQSEVHHDRPLHCLALTARGITRLALISFTGKAEVQTRFLVPSLRPRLEAIASALHAPEGSHTRREIFRLAQLIPIGLLLSRPDPMLKAWLTFMLDQRHARDPAHLFLVDAARGGCWIVRSTVGDDASPAAIHAFAQKHGLQIRTDFRRDGDDLSLHFLWLHGAGMNGARIRTILSENERSVLLSWNERFRLLAAERLTSEDATLHDVAGQARQLLQALDPATSVHISPRQAVDGLLLLQRAENDLIVRIGPTGLEHRPALHIYTRKRLLLGDIAPALDSCGLRIESALQLTFHLPDTPAFQHIFYLDSPPAPAVIVSLTEIVRAVVSGQTGTDGLNRLAIHPGMDLVSLRLLKALVACLYQLDRSCSRLFLSDLLVSHADFARSLCDMVRATFLQGPAPDEARRKDALSIINGQLEELRTLPERTTGRHLRDLAGAIVRLDLSEDLPDVALKIETRLLDFAPVPKPLFEIFVHSTDFEAVHLRAGPVSRGGIRWSDRIDDYRHEILGLMATQRLKNTMIVPDGSKGGFVLRDRKAHDPHAGVHAYRRFMNALLRLTDNLDSRGRPRHPAGIVCLDGFDPYLVVAADRGTATFSDTANQIAESHHFWLGDAFASGGRFGYDHKKQGITARGAWESVRAHFAHMGVDPDRDPIRAVGIGDMSGDVFGNGLLLSRSIRLIAAFNHRFIFLDPDPDPTRSYAERQRLFSRGLDWDSYSPGLFSPGGGVFERSSADIRLSSAARSMLDLTETGISGEALVRAILCARADLLWNGGIGTYVKASSERNEDVGDHTNDAVRVDGRDLRVRVVGEGGNLGFTMKGRYEAAANGVRLFTDAIDNSGGVDMSDHEVNLKILLKSLGRRRPSALSPATRERIIRRLEPTMVRQVISNNRSINLCISLEEERFRQEPWLLRLWTKELLGEGAMTADEIPDTFWQKEHAAPVTAPAASAGLNAPEHAAAPSGVPLPLLGNLVGWTKLHYRSRVDLEQHVSRSCPALLDLLLARYAALHVPGAREAILSHPLGARIILTEIINHIVHTAGITYIYRLGCMTGATPEDVICRRLSIERMTHAEVLRRRIDELVVSLPDRVRFHAALEHSLLRIAMEYGNRPVTSAGLPRSPAKKADDLLRQVEGLAITLCRKPGARSLNVRSDASVAVPLAASFAQLVDAIVLLPCSNSADLRFQGRLLEQLKDLRDRCTRQPDVTGVSARVAAATERATRGDGLVAIYEALNAR